MITPTYDRVVKSDGKPRIAHLTRVANALRRATYAARIHWIVVEDGAACLDDVTNLVQETRPALKGATYAHAGPSKVYGNLQRARGLEIVLKIACNACIQGDAAGAGGDAGYIYFADDDNLYLSSLFDHLVIAGEHANRAPGVTPPVLFIPVIFSWCGGSRVERPLVAIDDTTVVVGFDAGWEERVWPADNAGFAVHSRHLAAQTKQPEKGWFGVSKYSGVPGIPSDPGRLERLAALEKEVGLAATAAGGPLEQLIGFQEPVFLRYPQLDFGGESEFLESVLGNKRILDKTLVRAVDIFGLYMEHDPPVCQTSVKKLSTEEKTRFYRLCKQHCDIKPHSQADLKPSLPASHFTKLLKSP